jgi:predicted hydrocarbon binding protein
MENRLSMSESGLPTFILKHFVVDLRTELGTDTLSAVFKKAGLPHDWMNPAHLVGLTVEQAAHTFSRLQAAMRTYYGRGARGFLFRIGSALWGQILSDVPLALKAQAGLVHELPSGMRIKPALDLLAQILSIRSGDVTVHTMDLELLFVDRASPTSIDQHEEIPICFVTQGLIRECLYWAVGQEFDIEEISCCAMGAKECEFKIVTGVTA